MDFDPVLFMRCHGARLDPETDIQTQVWYTEFMPDPRNALESSNIVATAGGHKICFINVEEVKVWKRYATATQGEMFYCTAWINVPCNEFDSVTLLIAGSSIGKLHMLNVNQGTAVGEVSLFDHKRSKKNDKKQAIHSVCVHKDTEKRETLLCGVSCGTIYGLDLQCTKDQKDNLITSEMKILGNFAIQAELFQIVYCPSTQYVLAACDQGLYGIHMPSRDVFKNNNYKVIKFERPSEYQKKNCNLVDSVQIIGDGLISVKYALHGAIYVFDLKSSCQRADLNKSSSIAYSPKFVLEWSDTDNYFLNIGLSRAANLLACGDDKGSIWVYDMKSLKCGEAGDPKVIPPSVMLLWPETNDKHLAKKKKLDLSKTEIVINKVAIHSSGKYIVAVTNNNTVCLWKRTHTFSET